MKEMKKWQRNEVAAIRGLNKLSKTEIKLSTFEYEHFDALGTMNNGELVLVEIKSRWQWYPDLFIEVDKINRIKQHLLKSAKGGRGYLICSNNSKGGDGKHYLYDIETISRYKTETRLMNDKTEFGKSTKVMKEVYVFPNNIYIKKF